MYNIMKDLEKQVLELVKSSMPEAQAQAMKELMEEYTKLKSENPKMMKQIESLNEEIKISWETISQKSKIIAKLEDIIEKTAIDRLINEELSQQLKETSKNLDIIKLQNELSAYTKADEKISWFFWLVFKNMEYQKHYTENLSYSQFYQNWNSVQANSPSHINKEETLTIQEVR